MLRVWCGGHVQPPENDFVVVAAAVLGDFQFFIGDRSPVIFGTEPQCRRQHVTFLPMSPRVYRRPRRLPIGAAILTFRVWPVSASSMTISKSIAKRPRIL